MVEILNCLTWDSRLITYARINGEMNLKFTSTNGFNFWIIKKVAFRLGNPDLDFEIRISDFAIEREIRKQISLRRNPSSWWVSIKKSKSGFHGFPLYRSIEKSEKGFAKLFWNRGQLCQLLGVCTLCFCFPTKMLHLNASFFPLKCSVSPKKSLKCSENAHYTNGFFKLISNFTHTKTCKCCK